MKGSSTIVMTRFVYCDELGVCFGQSKVIKYVHRVACDA